MGSDTVVRALNAEIADLQRIIDADEAILQHEKSQEKHDALVNEICELEGKIEKLKKRRDFIQFG